MEEVREQGGGGVSGQSGALTIPVTHGAFPQTAKLIAFHTAHISLSFTYSFFLPKIAGSRFGPQDQLLNAFQHQLWRRLAHASPLGAGGVVEPLHHLACDAHSTLVPASLITFARHPNVFVYLFATLL